MIPPNFSIITPTLNSEKTIGKTVNSVLSQSHKSFEYLIIDGSSSDDTLISIELNDQRLNIQSEEDNGIFDAMNKGISKSKGAILGIINSDDWYKPNTLEVVWKLFETTNADIVLAGVDIYENEVLIGSRLHSVEELKDHMVSHPAVFVKRSVYESIGAFNLDYKIASDYDFILRAMKHGYNFTAIHQPLAVYSLGGFSDSPENRIISIVETESIRFKNGFITRRHAVFNFISYSIKTILGRQGKLKMSIQFKETLKNLAFYFEKRSIL